MAMWSSGMGGSVEIFCGKIMKQNGILRCSQWDGCKAGRGDCRKLSTRNGGREVTHGVLSNNNMRSCGEVGFTALSSLNNNNGKCSSRGNNLGNLRVKAKAWKEVVPEDIGGAVEEKVARNSTGEFGGYVYDTYDERIGDERKSTGLTLTGSAPGQSPRDEEGRSMAGRKKPLKINIDLALYRARQMRIQSNRSNSKERSRLLREAEKILKECISKDAEDGRAYVILGKILVQQRRYDEAEALYESGCAATGGVNAFLWTAWANLAVKRGNISLGRKLFDAAVVAKSSHAAAYHGWGLLEKSQGRLARARDIWIRGIDATRPNSSPYLFQSLAVLAAELNKPDEARRWFRDGTQTGSGIDSHALWHAWAVLESKEESDPELVRELFQRGLKASPKSRYTYLSWALWEKKLGNVEKARELFRKGSNLNRGDAALLQGWALMEEEEGDLDKCRDLFKRASMADSKHLYVWQGWGCMEQRAGNIEVARELFQQGVWAAPPRAKGTSLIFQAWALLEKDEGNYELARELFKCAVKADPSSQPSWMAWAKMEEDMGLITRAAELRNYGMQEKQIVNPPVNFTTLKPETKDGLLSPLFSQLVKWFHRYESSESSDSWKEQN